MFKDDYMGLNAPLQALNVSTKSEEWVSTEISHKGVWDEKGVEEKTYKFGEKDYPVRGQPEYLVLLHALLLILRFSVHEGQYYGVYELQTRR